MLYGASHPEALVRRAAERGMEWLALTDRDNFTGAVRLAKSCAAHGVRPIFGVDLAVASTRIGGGFAPVPGARPSHGNLVTRRSRPASEPRRGVSPRSPSPASRRPRCPDVRRGWRTGRRCGPPLAGRSWPPSVPPSGRGGSGHGAPPVPAG
ncbi:PHP domain-containing protein [Streptomyces sp. NPDC059378]|uniref:PHP domain-containing protein n=1 Tax=Streptomyces sp. NPDC059378 TaxID=3346815 RepID=UPI00368340F6